MASGASKTALSRRSSGKLGIVRPGEDVAVVDLALQLAAGVQRLGLREGDELLGEALDRLGLGERGLDLTVLEEAGREVPHHGGAVGGGAIELLAVDTVTHRWILEYMVP